MISPRKTVSGAVAKDATGSDAAHPAMPLCASTGDFYTPEARRHMRLLLASHLNNRQVTPLEVLHSYDHARRLNDEGMTLMGVLQKVAGEQGKQGDVSTQERLKTLTSLSTALLTELHKAEKDRKVPGIRPGGFADAIKQVRDLYPEEELPFHIHRMLTAFVASASGWLEKLERLGLLWDGRVEKLGRVALDAQIAETVSMAGALKALTGDRKTRLDMILSLIALYQGERTAEGAPLKAGVSDVLDLLRDGTLKLTRETLRERVVREIEQRAFLVPGEDVLVELEAIRRLEEILDTAPADLAGDRQVRRQLEIRSGRAITPEGVQASVAAAGSFTERLEVLLRIAELSMGVEARDELSNFVRGSFAVEDVIRDVTRRGGQRWEAAGPLVRIHGQLGRANIHPQLAQELQGQAETALNQLIAKDILGDRNRPFAERIARLVESCGDEPLPTGKVRQLAAAALASGLRSQDFLQNYAKHYRGEAQRKEALLRLRDMMVAVGIAAAKPGNGGGSQPQA